MKTTKQPILEQPILEQPILEQPILEQPILEQPILEQPSLEQPSLEQPSLEQPSLEPTILITGGAGFLARALVQELLKPAEEGVLQPRWIRLLDTRKPQLVEDPRLEFIAGDITIPRDLEQACIDVDLVIHCAALVDWGQNPPEKVTAVNIDGTNNVIAACQQAGVRALVHVSTLDVVLNKQPILDGDEELPIPLDHGSVYCHTKAAAEQLALRANGSPRAPRAPRDSADAAPLRVVALRPSCIFGEADPYHVSSLLSMARRGPLFRLGNGKARHQHVYVGNMAHALTLAGRALLLDLPEVAGQAFFITDFPAQNFFDYMEPIVKATGGRMLPWRLSLPYRPMYALGAAMETLADAVRPIFSFTPLMSRFSVRFVCQSFTLRTTKAARLLNYHPIYSEEQAFDRTIAYFREHEMDH